MTTNKKRIEIHITEKMLKQIASLADKDNRSVKNYLEYIIYQHLIHLMLNEE